MRAGQCSDDVRIVGVVDGIRPDAVEDRHERTEELLREIDHFVFIVLVGILRHESGRAEIPAGPFDNPLSVEDHQLPMEDVARRFAAHRDTRVLQLIELVRVRRVARVRSRIHEHTHVHAPVLRPDQRLHVAVVLEEPDADVDTDALVVDQIQERRTTVFG